MTSNSLTYEPLIHLLSNYCFLEPSFNNWFELQMSTQFIKLLQIKKKKFYCDLFEKVFSHPVTSNMSDDRVSPSRYYQWYNETSGTS